MVPALADRGKSFLPENRLFRGVSEQLTSAAFHGLYKQNGYRLLETIHIHETSNDAQDQSVSCCEQKGFPDNIHSLDTLFRKITVCFHNHFNSLN